MELKPAHYDGKRFYNQEPHTNTFMDFLKWRWERNTPDWPEWVENNLKPNIEPKVEGKIKVTYINHETFLIQVAGLNILTDPIYSERASPVSFAGPKRVHAPGIPFESLPKIDIVLVSHSHYDHLDIPTIEMLVKRDNPVIYTGLKLGKYIKKNADAKIVHDMDWWQTMENKGIQITYTPAHHWSARGLFDRSKTLWGSFVIEYKGKKLYFAGDTAWGVHFEQLASKYGNFDIALLPIGTYEPRWFMKNSHINPEEAVMAHITMKSKLSIGMHFNCFANLAEDRYNQAVEELAESLTRHNIDKTSFIAPLPGQEFEIAE
ncbi:MAG: MBL fold metallo-hydrolase [Alphaproteobacteria bacterium]|nr:MBL fold metallo-hydrolase [Alphaproteobacteria bacterium]